MRIDVIRIEWPPTPDWRVQQAINDLQHTIDRIRRVGGKVKVTGGHKPDDPQHQGIPSPAKEDA